MTTGPTNSFSAEAGSIGRSRAGESDAISVSENDDGVRNLKASESVTAAFHAEGFPNPPAGIADIISTHVKNSTRDIPLSKMANMSPGSGSLGTSASAGVNMFLNMLTPQQREAAKAGINPLDPAAVLKFSVMMSHQLNASGSLMANGSGGSLSSRGGNQFAELRGGGTSSDTSTAAGSGYSMLTAANQNIPGFTQGQVASAANFLKDHGASRDDINHDTRHMVHLKEYQKPIGDLATRQREIDRRRGRGEDVGADQAKLDGEKKDFRDKLPQSKRPHFDELNVIRPQDKTKMELDQKAALDSGQTLTDDNRRLGVAEKVENHHKERIAELDSKPAATDDLAARLARRSQQSKQAEAPTAAPAKKTADQAAAGTQTASTAKPAEQRQATNSKGLNPTV